MKRINDPSDPLLDDFRMVREADLFARGTFLVEGAQATAALLQRSHYKARAIFVCDKKLVLHERLFVQVYKTPIYIASQDVMDAVVGFPVQRGLLASGARAALPLSSMCERAETLLVLEALASHSNVGAVFRNAAAFGADGVVLSPNCADPLYRQAIRASMGATLQIPFSRPKRWPEALDTLRETGFQILALTPKADRTVEQLSGIDGVGRVALLLGTEGVGLSEAALARSTEKIAIEMDNFDSINVATASGVALFALRLRRKSDGG